MSMADGALPERPRERLRARGAAALSDAELLALLVRPGARGTDAVALARGHLARFGRVSTLLAAAEGEFRASGAPGANAFAALAAVMELARRALTEEMRSRDSLTSPGAVRGYLRLRLQDLGHEAFYGVFLDAQNRVIEAEELFRGTLTQTSVYPCVFRSNALFPL
jgi:DNA repair protein RadC